MTHEYSDVLRLDDAAFQRWLSVTHDINEQLFGRPLSPIHVDRENACFIRTLQVYDKERCVGRANLSLFPMESFEPMVGRRSQIYAAVGGGGVLHDYDSQVNIYPFVIRTMAEFHLSHLTSKRNTYLLATNLTPLASFLFARFFPCVHPFPGRKNPAFEKLRYELISTLYPKSVEEYESRGLFSGPKPPHAPPAIRTDNPLLASYVELHGNWREGDRLPMLVRMSKNDLKKTAYTYFTMQLAKRTGRYNPARVSPYRLLELLSPWSRS